jgi:S-adenosylmethionine synthetase
VFRAQWNEDYEKANQLAKEIYKLHPSDGKYIFGAKNIICQSCFLGQHSQAQLQEKIDQLEKIVGKDAIINPLGEWTGGIAVDSGATNRKLGSDQPLCNPNGLHGKDLSKGDVSVSIVANLLSRENEHKLVTAAVSIGDVEVSFKIGDQQTLKISFSDVVKKAKKYVDALGGFEKFAEWGLQ